MKTKRIYICLAAVLLAPGIFQSCTRLDQKVYSVAPGENFWQTPDQIAAGIAPAYQALTSLPVGDVYQLNDISGGAIIVPTRGSDWYDNGAWQALWLHKWLPDLGPVNNAWGALFNGIGKANFTLSALNAISNKPANIANINAELKVLRAYYYYMAMDMFGKVPVVTDFNVDPGTITNDKPRADIFTFIEKEINDNIASLSDAKDPSTYGRMTKWGAYTLLAKLYLNAQVYTGTARWADCITACNAVIASGKYTITSNYFENFLVNNEGSTENIFVVPFDKKYIGGMNWEMTTLHYDHNKKYNLTSTPWNGFCSTADFYNNFDAADHRRAMFLVGQQFDANGNPINDAQTGLPLIISKYVNELSNPNDTFRLAGARNVKYEPEAGTAGGASNDYAIFRLGDVYLMRAEAEFRLGQTAAALSDVNVIRQRAYGDLLHNWTAVDLTADNLYKEREREMAWEGWGRQDAIRFGHFGDARLPGKTADADAHLQIFPIPSPQISANSKLTQNPGY